MDIKKIEKIAADEMKSRRDCFREPGWIFYHGMRTGKIAVNLAEEMNLAVDKELLYVGGLFHDVGKRAHPHNETGADIAGKLLAGELTAFELEEVIGMILNHNRRKQQEAFSEYDKLIQDADILDHTGKINIWMGFYWTGTHNENITKYIDYFRSEKYFSWRKYMQESLNYKLSQEILKNRLDLEDKFFNEFSSIYYDGI